MFHGVKTPASPSEFSAPLRRQESFIADTKPQLLQIVSLQSDNVLAAPTSLVQTTVFATYYRRKEADRELPHLRKSGSPLAKPSSPANG